MFYQVIDFKGFREGVKKLNLGLTEPEILDFFRSFDADGSGGIDFSEVSNAIRCDEWIQCAPNDSTTGVRIPVWPFVTPFSRKKKKVWNTRIQVMVCIPVVQAKTQLLFEVQQHIVHLQVSCGRGGTF